MLNNYIEAKLFLIIKAGTTLRIQVWDEAQPIFFPFNFEPKCLRCSTLGTFSKLWIHFHLRQLLSCVQTFKFRSHNKVWNKYWKQQLFALIQANYQRIIAANWVLLASQYSTCPYYTYEITLEETFLPLSIYLENFHCN